MPQVSTGFSVWNDSDCERWRELVSSYPAAIAQQGSDKLTNLDRWFREELPATLAERAEHGNACIYLDELQGIAAWKMSRGVWRERNRMLISTNPPDSVVETSR